MKYLILANNSGGLYRFRKELMERLIQDGHEVYAVTPFDEYIEELKSEGMEQLHKKYENIILDVVGWCEEDYESKLMKLQSQGMIRFHGFQRDVNPCIRQAHAFVLPSYHEGMANTLLESGAMGRPLITSRIHGCMEAVQDGETGFLCEVQNAESLMLQMERFINLPYEQKKQMGYWSHVFVAEHFDKKKVVQETVEKIYAENGN